MAVKKKLLIVNDLLVGGGVEKLMFDLVWHWHDKYDITIMIDQADSRFEELYPSNVQCVTARPAKKYDENFFQKVYGSLYYRRHFYSKLQKLRSDGRFDIAIALKDGWKMLQTLQVKAPIRYGWVHTDYNSYYFTQGIFGSARNEFEAMKQYTGIVCVSEDIRKGIVDVLGDPGNLMVRYNPIDIANVLEMAQEPVVDVDLDKKPGMVRFVTVGRINMQKGYDLLLEACHLLDRDGITNYEVWVIGGTGGQYNEQERLTVAEKRLNVKNVKFLGGRKNPYKYMACGDWFLSTSVFEGYSLVSQEAAVLDIPLILTDCSGVRELIGDSEYGIVMERSVLGIYEGMKRVIEHPELRQHYKEKIMERKSIINYDERLKAIEDLLD